MQKLLRVRPLQIDEILYGRALKPFEEKGLVINAYDPESKFELVMQMMADTYFDTPNYEHLMLKTGVSETPYSIYQHLINNDDFISPIYIVDEISPGVYKKIYAVKDYHNDLKPVVERLHSRNCISAKHLVPMRGDEYEF